MAQGHSSDPRRMHPTLPDQRLGHIRQVLLQVGEPRTHHHQIGVHLGDTPRGARHSDHLHQWILRRPVAVGRWEERRTLGVRNVVGTSGGRTDELDPVRSEDVNQLVGLGQVDPRSGSVTSEAEGHRRSRVTLLGHSGPVRAGHERHHVVEGNT